jgi:hypothetical protein
MQQTNAPRQRLTDALHQTELLRAGQHEQAHAPIVIDARLQIRKQLRRPLRLVQYRAIGKLRQETARIARRQRPHIQIFKARIRLVRKRGPRQRGLARLARAGNRHHRVVAGEFSKAGGGESVQHGKTMAPGLQFVN